MIKISIKIKNLAFHNPDINSSSIYNSNNNNQLEEFPGLNLTSGFNANVNNYESDKFSKSNSDIIILNDLKNSKKVIFNFK